MTNTKNVPVVNKDFQLLSFIKWSIYISILITTLEQW